MKVSAIKLLFITVPALALASLGGCASSEPMKPANLAAVSGAPGAKGGTATMTFYRPRGFVGGGLNTSIYVDGIEIADMDPGNYVVVKAAAGSHDLHSDEAKDKFSVKLEPGKNYFYRVKIMAGAWKGHGVLLPVDNETGMKECVGKKLAPCKDIRQPSVVVQDVPQS